MKNRMLSKQSALQHARTSFAKEVRMWERKRETLDRVVSETSQDGSATFEVRSNEVLVSTSGASTESSVAGSSGSTIKGDATEAKSRKPRPQLPKERLPVPQIAEPIVCDAVMEENLGHHPPGVRHLSVVKIIAMDSDRDMFGCISAARRLFHIKSPKDLDPVLLCDLMLCNGTEAIAH